MRLGSSTVIAHSVLSFAAIKKLVPSFDIQLSSIMTTYLCSNSGRVNPFPLLNSYGPSL